MKRVKLPCPNCGFELPEIALSTVKNKQYFTYQCDKCYEILRIEGEKWVPVFSRERTYEESCKIQRERSI